MSEAFNALLKIVKVGQTIFIRIFNKDGQIIDKTGVVVSIMSSGVIIETNCETEYVNAEDVTSWRLQKQTDVIIDNYKNSSKESILESSRCENADSVSIPLSLSQQNSSQMLNLVHKTSISQSSLKKDVSSSLPTTNINAASNQTFSEIELVFAGEPFLPQPKPNFDFPNVSEGVRKSIDRWRDRYNYAQKVHEPARMSQDVTGIVELAETLNDYNLFFLAGYFSLISGLGTNRAQSYYQQALQRGSRQAGIALCALLIDNKDWEKSIESLLTTINISPAEKENQSLLRVLGQCLMRCDNKHFPGIGSLLLNKLDRQSQRLACLIVAFTVKDDQAAFEAALSNDPDSLRLTKLGNQLFYWENESRLKIIDNTNLPSQQILLKMPHRRGNISAFYIDRRFGFLVEETTGQTWFFRQEVVEDDKLMTLLLTGQIRQQVSFNGNPSALSGRYPTSNDVRLIASDNSEPTPSLGRAPLSRRLASIPKDQSAYSRAKKAEALDQLEEAERFYSEAIEKDNDYSKSAIKDLATLQNRRDSDLAVKTLDRYTNRFAVSELTTIDQMKAHFLVKAKRYQEASQILIKLSKVANSGQKKLDILRQEAFCHFASGSFNIAIDKLQALLILHPSDNATVTLLNRVKESMSSGTSAAENESIANSLFDANVSTSFLEKSLSVLARQHIDNCELDGVDERSIEKNTFEHRDFDAVKSLVNRIKGRRPREQAKYLLTLAKLCELVPGLNESEMKQRYLMWYFAALTEAAMNEKASADVAICYAIESLRFHSTEHRDNLENAWVLLLGTYCSDMPEPSALLIKDNQIRSIFGRFKENKKDWERFLCDASYYKILIPVAFDELQRHFKNEGLGSADIDVTKEQIRMKEDDTAFHTVGNSVFSSDYLRQAREILSKRSTNARFELDKERMSTAAKLFADSADYILERHFRERETRYLRLDKEISDFLIDISNAPTILSFEKLFNVMQKLHEMLHANFETICNTQPILEIRNVLDKDFNTLNKDRVTLRLNVLSQNESAPPVDAIDIKVDGCKSDPCHQPEPLQGGQNREMEVVIYPTSQQISDGTFSIGIQIQYRNRKNNIEQSELKSLAVRLSSDKFVPIENPYSRYSGGSPVEDEAMFFGRTSLVDRIVSHLSIGSLGQCFVLYGQKRSGKSSVLRQVEKKLSRKCIFVPISAGTFDTSNLWESFSRIVVQELEFRMEDYGIAKPTSWPTFSDVSSHPIETIRLICRELSKKSFRLVVAVDEFTYIYEKSSSEIETFMRGWKALLEGKSFNSLIIGQDTMPRFKQKYPNEFGVTHDERISYLSFEEAELLATQPILYLGQTRYRGQAINRLFTLTAGSPFFMQIVCDQLVTHLNGQHAPFITEADIDHVRQVLSVGNDALPPERFDPLVTAAGENVATIPREMLWNILARIAKESLHSEWCYRSALSDLPLVEKSLKDLTDREILSTEQDRIKIRVGLFSAWLRANQQQLESISK